MARLEVSMTDYALPLGQVCDMTAACIIRHTPTCLPVVAKSQVCGPGDILQDVPSTGTLRLGPGLTTHDGAVTCIKAGMLQQQPKTGQLWLHGKQRR